MPLPPEIICAGELLVDLISTEYADDFRSAHTFRRYAGGSPANLATNLARLGRRVSLVAAVGRDDTGSLLIDDAAAAGVDTSAIRRVTQPTTLIMVTKSTEVSDFEAYRSADTEITDSQFADLPFTDCRVLHTTAFALSREPARTAILRAANRLHAAGGRVSIDLNYAARIWPEREEARRVLADYLAIGRDTQRAALVKLSEVDYGRLFTTEPIAPSEACRQLHALGAGVVCYTLGGEGCYVSDGSAGFHLPARPVEVRDTTGAGDAFWSGFLAAYLEGYDWPSCAVSGRSLAERKLVTVGPLQHAIQLAELLNA